ncbi:hypothetical protein ACIQXV_24535 [Neobacillus sp. NPDC097160]|uniref:hypothetical protein n=1 Tax=Neobacillus sp. NPDC097160 TaxID=3364298 RepID=UPI0038097B45
MSNSGINQERLQYLQNYFNNQSVKVEVKPFISHTSKGTITYRFNGSRYGYQFHDGFADVKKEDLWKFQQESHFIIHDNKGEK